MRTGLIGGPTVPPPTGGPGGPIPPAPPPPPPGGRRPVDDPGIERKLARMQIRAREQMATEFTRIRSRTRVAEEQDAAGRMALLRRTQGERVKAAEGERGLARMQIQAREQRATEITRISRRQRMAEERDASDRTAILRRTQRARNEATRRIKNIARREIRDQKMLIMAQRDAERQQQRMIKTQDRLALSTGRVGRQFNIAFRRILQWAAISGILFGVQRAFRNMFSVIIEVNDAMARLQRLLPGTAKTFDALRMSAVATAQELGLSVREVIGSMEIFAKKFKDQATVARLSRDALLLTNISTQTLQAGTENLIATIEQFNFGAENSTRIIDAWAAVSTQAKVSVDDLGDAAAGAGKAAIAAGLSFDQMNGLVAAVAEETNASGKEIAATMRRVFERLTSPDQARKLQKLGVLVTTIGESGLREFRPFGDVVTDIRKRFAEASEKGEGFEKTIRKQIATAAAGARRWTQFLAVIDSWDKAQRLAKISADSFGEAARQNALVVESLGKKMERVRAGFENIALAAGRGGLQSVLGGTLEILNRMLIAFSKLPGFIQATTVAATGLAATLASAQFALGILQAPGVAKGPSGAFRGLGSLQKAREARERVRRFRIAGREGIAEREALKVGIFARVGLAMETVGRKALGAIPGLKGFALGLSGVSAALVGMGIIAGVILLVTGLIQVISQLARDPLKKAEEGFKLFGFTLQKGTNQLFTEIEAIKQNIKAIDDLIDTKEKLAKTEDKLQRARNFAELLEKQKGLIDANRKAFEELTPELQRNIAERTLAARMASLTNITTPSIQGGEITGVFASLKAQKGALALAAGEDVKESLKVTTKSAKDFLMEMVESIDKTEKFRKKIDEMSAANDPGLSTAIDQVKDQLAAQQVETVKNIDGFREMEENARLALGIMLDLLPRAGEAVRKNLIDQFTLFNRIAGPTMARAEIASLVETFKAVGLKIDETAEETKGVAQEFDKWRGKIRLTQEAISQLEKSLIVISLRQKAFGAGVNVLSDVTNAFRSGIDSLIQAQATAILKTEQNVLTLRDLADEKAHAVKQTEQLNEITEQGSNAQKRFNDRMDDVTHNTNQATREIKKMKAALPELIREFNNLRAVSETIDLFREGFKTELTQIEKTFEARRKGERTIAQERINLNAQVAQENIQLQKAQQAGDMNAVRQSQFRLDQISQQFDQLDRRGKGLQRETSVLGKVGRGIRGRALEKAIGGATDISFNLLGGALTETLAPSFASLEKALAFKDPVRAEEIRLADQTSTNTRKTSEGIEKLFLLLSGQEAGANLRVGGILDPNATADELIASRNRGVGGLNIVDSLANTLTLKQLDVIDKEDAIAEKQSSAADALGIAGRSLQGAAIGFGITAARGRRGPGGGIGGAIGGALGQFGAQKSGTLLGSLLGPIGGLLGGFIGSLFDKKVSDEFVDPLIPPLEENTDAIRENTNASRLQTTAIEKIINAPANFSIPPAAVRGGFIPSAQTGAFVERAGIIRVHKNEEIIPAGKSGGIVIQSLSISSQSSDPSEVAKEVVRKMATEFNNQAQTAGVRRRRI